MASIIFKPQQGDTIEVSAIPGASVMQLATSNAIPGIDAECGGSLSCATCHVYVDADWLERVGEPQDTEKVMLQFAHNQQDNSRLSCQIRYREDLNGLIVHIPERQ